MKKIEAIIRPEKFEQVKNALDDAGYSAMTVTDVRGRGLQKGITLQYRGKKMEVSLIPKVKIEIVLNDRDAGKVISIIKNTAYTGRVGDGKIFVMPVEQFIAVREEEENQQE